jgi:quercetin dioxygenase-like cupin family protein
VILEGSGTLELWPTATTAARGVQREDHELRAGHVFARPPGTAHRPLGRSG